MIEKRTKYLIIRSETTCCGEDVPMDKFKLSMRDCDELEFEGRCRKCGHLRRGVAAVESLL